MRRRSVVSRERRELVLWQMKYRKMGWCLRESGGMSERGSGLWWVCRFVELRRGGGRSPRMGGVLGV